MRHGRRNLDGFINAGLFSSQDGGGAVDAVLNVWRRHCNGVSKRLRLGTNRIESLTPVEACRTHCVGREFVGGRIFVVGGGGINNFVLRRFLHIMMSKV